RWGAFDRRRGGGRPAADAWDSRRLPAPHARVLFGGIETAEHFGPRVRRWAARLGIRDAAAVSVLADGAEWIWNQAAAQLPGAAGVSGIYPAGGHPAGARRGDGRGAGLAGGGAGGAAGGRLAGAGRADGGHAAAGEVAGQAAGAGRGGGLLLPAAGAPGLRGAAGAGAADRQRAGGGGVQAGDRAAHEADRGAVAGAAGQPHGDAVLHAAWRHPENPL